MPRLTAGSRPGPLLGVIGLLSTAGLVTACGLAVPTAQSGAPRAATAHTPAPLTGAVIQQPRLSVSPPPHVIGSAMRPLWQGAPWDVFTVSDGLVIGRPSVAGRNSVVALSALTGAGVWATQIPRSLPDVLGFVPGGSVGIIEAGRSFGRAPTAVRPEATTEIAVDMATGRQLWMARLSGLSQSPPIVVSGNEVLTGSPAGVITARNAETGRLLWTRPRHADCARLAVASPVDEGMGLAGDGALVAASFECADGSVVVQRLDPGTGKPAWTWSSPPATSPGAGTYLTVTGVASAGDLVLLTGQVTPDATPLARLVRHAYLWPYRLGPLLDNEVVLTLDATTGHPRWIEIGGQLEDFTLTDAAVCEVANTGLECRDDVTGAPTRPVLVTGHGGGGAPPYVNDGWAGISGSLAAVTVGPFRSGEVIVELVPVRGRRPVGRAVIDIGVTAYRASYQTYVVGAGTLPGGGIVLLLRRVDLPGYPLVALRVATGR